MLGLKMLKIAFFGFQDHKDFSALGIRPRTPLLLLSL